MSSTKPAPEIDEVDEIITHYQEALLGIIKTLKPKVQEAIQACVDDLVADLIDMYEPETLAEDEDMDEDPTTKLPTGTPLKSAKVA